MDRYYRPTRTVTPSLTHDDAIYWCDTAYYLEQGISQEELIHERIRGMVYDRTRAELDYAVQQKAQELGWAAYHQESSERHTEGITFIRCTFYECPSYGQIRLWRGLEDRSAIVVKPTPNANMITLPSRRLMYHGERVRGVLHDNVLYVLLFSSYPR